MKKSTQRVIAVGALGTLVPTAINAVDFSYNNERFRDDGRTIVMLRSEDGQPSNFKYLEYPQGEFYFDADNSGNITSSDIKMSSGFNQTVARARQSSVPATTPRRIPADAAKVIDFDYFSQARNETNNFTLWSDETATMGDATKGEVEYRFVPGWFYDVDNSGTYTRGDEAMANEFNIDFTQTIVNSLINARNETVSAQTKFSELERTYNALKSEYDTLSSRQNPSTGDSGRIRELESQLGSLRGQYTALENEYKEIVSVASSRAADSRQPVQAPTPRYTREELAEELAKIKVDSPDETPASSTSTEPTQRTASPAPLPEAPLDYNARILGYNARITVLDEQIKLYETQIKNYQTRVGSLEGQLEETQTRFDELVRNSGRSLDSTVKEPAPETEAVAKIKRNVFGITGGVYHSFALGTPAENFWAAEVGAIIAPLDWLKFAITGIAGTGKEFSVTETGEASPRGIYGQGVTTTTAGTILGGALDVKFGGKINDNLGFSLGLGLSITQRNAVESITEGTYNADGSVRILNTPIYNEIKELSVAPRLGLEIFFNKAGFGLEAMLSQNPKLKDTSIGLRISTR